MCRAAKEDDIGPPLRPDRLASDATGVQMTLGNRRPDRNTALLKQIVIDWAHTITCREQLADKKAG
jgi:hypothetical protein